MSRKTLEVTPSKISYHRPLGMRVGVGGFGLLLGVMCLSLFGFFWPTATSLALRSPADVLCQLVPLLLVPLLGLCGPTALFLYLAGPADLILDTDHHTYRFRRGFPGLASWKNGLTADISGLRVEAISRRADTTYQLILDWKNTQATPWTLGDGPVANRRPVQMSTSRDAGSLRQEAQRLAQQIGVPLQEKKPSLERARNRAQRRLMLIPVVLFFLLFGLPPVLVNHALQSQGQNTQGVVTALRHGKGYSVRYTYQVSGLSFQGRSVMSRSAYDDLDIGSHVPVRYLPGYPHTSAMAGFGGASNSALLLLCGGTLVVLVLVSTRTQKDD